MFDFARCVVPGSVEARRLKSIFYDHGIRDIATSTCDEPACVFTGYGHSTGAGVDIPHLQNQ